MKWITSCELWLELETSAPCFWINLCRGHFNLQVLCFLLLNSAFPPQLWNLPQTGHVSMPFKLLLVGLALVHFFLANFVELLFSHNATRRLVRRLRRSRAKLHHQLSLQLCSAWPPITMRVETVRDLDADVFSGPSEASWGRERAPLPKAGRDLIVERRSID